MRLSRRHFLWGAGGAVALPFLPSLARAQQAFAPKYFIQFCVDHGGIGAQDNFPTMQAPTVAQVASRGVRRQALSGTVSGADTVVSNILKAPSSKLTPRLISKMNVLQGLDLPFRMGHQTGGHLGNMNASPSTTPVIPPRATIDQLMAWSPSFYPSLTGIRERAMVMGDRLSYGYSNPATRTGSIMALSSNQDSLSWFNRFFPANAQLPGGTAPRPPIVSQVMDSYRALRANPRLSAEDQRRIDDHLQRLAETQRRLTVAAPTTCTRPPAPIDNRSAIGGRVGLFKTDPGKHATWYQLLNDVMVAAMACDLTRVATVRLDATFSSFAGDWHQDVAHQMGLNGQVMRDSMQAFFAQVFVDLAAKLDSVSDGMGGTLLDHTLLVWSNEYGTQVHVNRSTPIITFGSAGGWLATGQHVDYRDQNLAFELNPQANTARPGFLLHQWWGTALQAMGVPRTEWAEPDHGGYGYKYVDVDFQNGAHLSNTTAYPDAMWAQTSDPLPFLKA